MCRLYHNRNEGFYIRLCSHAAAPKGHHAPPTATSISLACRDRRDRLREQIDDIANQRSPFTRQRIG